MPIEIPSLNLPVREVERDRYLYTNGLEADRVFIIRSGRVLLLGGPKGRRADLVVASDFVGLELIHNAVRYETSVRVLSDKCLVQPVDREHFQELLNSDPLFQRGLLLSEHQRVQRLWRFKASLNRINAKSSIAQVLVDLAEGDPPTIELVNQGVIAALAGVTREAVNKQLSIFRARGLIYMTNQGNFGTSIHIGGPNRLSAVAEG